MSEPATEKPPLQLKSQKFREAREKDWKALAKQVDRAENGGLGKFTTEELLDLPVLYRSTVSSLSMAQSISLDRNLIGFLQALCARAYVYMYGPHARPGVIARNFFLRELPRSVRALWGELALSFLCLALGILGGILMCMADPSWYDPLVGGMSQGRDLNASADNLRKTISGAEDGEPLAAFSVFLMTHNTKVTLMAFALGVIGGLPTAFLMIVFGMSLGAMVWLFASHGLGVDFVAWLSIHGTTELAAVVIGAAAGFHLARRIMFPGHLTRKAALSQAGRLAGTAMMGAMLMLIIAGFIEGVARQTVTEMWARFTFGGVMLAFWLAYYIGMGRERRPPAQEVSRGEA
ncbi:stage II sporulation protein M [Asticcacaulis sp. AND118]|uniref:stage II sporulation protein M n=1 Tax=Asticcacaulis sp. AND118 TaxID=2840468 RepID=UPI001D0017E3|nr:stage II sporulation protein M [Asticcacaulis sp. AND118]UDF04910.1 stage II sporulation protein M [Asticcacaulis sp. AND118]